MAILHFVDLQSENSKALGIFQVSHRQCWWKALWGRFDP